jgi:hypothetical protein
MKKLSHFHSNTVTKLFDNYISITFLMYFALGVVVTIFIRRTTLDKYIANHNTVFLILLITFAISCITLTTLSMHEMSMRSYKIWKKEYPRENFYGRMYFLFNQICPEELILAIQKYKLEKLKTPGKKQTLRNELFKK